MESTPLSSKTKLYFHLPGLAWILLSLVITFIATAPLSAKAYVNQDEPAVMLTNDTLPDTAAQEIITEIPEAETEVVPGTTTQQLETDNDQVNDNEPDSTEVVPTGPYTKTELRKGERLFKGLLAFGSGMHDCSSCHYSTRVDSLNWNPSAYDLAVIWQENEEYSIREVLANPAGMRMMNDHNGMSINPEEERQLEAYFEKVASSGLGDIKRTPVNALIFWGLGFLMALALLDLLVTKKVQFKALHMLIIIAGLVVHMQYAVAGSQALGRTQGYAPDQPIKFSHLIHAGENGIDCNYCHTISSFSLSAGIPSNNTCLNCHSVIREGTNSGRFEINKIHQAEASGEAVRWIRIHKLPDHSFFSHAQHVNAGKLECEECHGPVEEMHILQQVEDLSMGWCLTCHRDQEVDFLDNPYYLIYERLHDDMRTGRIDAVTAAMVGGEDCMKCHH